MKRHSELSDTNVRQMIHQREICLGGNGNLKIYGSLSCTSGKRMHRVNRVFFATEEEALQQGYRPCGNCMREQYQQWKNDLI